MRALGTLLALAVLAAAWPAAARTLGRLRRGPSALRQGRVDGRGEGGPGRERLRRDRCGSPGPGIGTVRGASARTGWRDLDVSGLDLVTKGATVVHLRGHGPDLVLLSAKPHPRGGAQPHLFGAGGQHGLTEVTAAGQPVVSFVATDGGAAPMMTATCTKDGGVAIVTGTASEPPGIVLAWDLRGAYDVVDGRAVHPRSAVLAEGRRGSPATQGDARAVRRLAVRRLQLTRSNAVGGRVVRGDGRPDGLAAAGAPW